MKRCELHESEDVGEMSAPVRRRQIAHVANEADRCDERAQSLVPPLPVIESSFATDHHCDFWSGVIRRTRVR